MNITLKSGHTLVLGMASFSAGTKLFKTVANELKEAEVDLSSLDLKELAGKDVNSIKNAVFQLLGSDALEAAVFECMTKSTLQGSKITRDSFAPEDMRGDYLPVAWEVIKFNLAPFFSNLDLSSSTSAKLPAGAPP